jgi:hypothetical protein
MRLRVQVITMRHHVGHAHMLVAQPSRFCEMFNSKRSRIEARLKVVEARIEQLKAQVESSVVPEQPESATNSEPSKTQGQSDHARARADSGALLDQLAGPEGRKARIKTDLWLAVEQGERLQLDLERLDARRLAQFKALVGDSLQFVVALGVLRWLLGMSWSASIAVALVITVLFGMLYEAGKNTRRSLEILVLERAERISKQEGISLVEAQRRVEVLKWP